MIFLKNKYILAACCLLVFILLIAAVRFADVEAIGPAGTSVGLSHVNKTVHDSLGESDTWYKISKWLGYLALAAAAGTVCFGLWQLISRRSLKKVDSCLLVTGGLYAATALLYVLFNKVAVNYRPVLEAGQAAPEPSFPSSHTLLACVIFGSLVMLFPRYVRNPGLRRLLQGGCVAALVLTVAARLLSGVHWVTDILGGLLISAALLCLAAALLQKYSKEKQEGVQ